MLDFAKSIMVGNASYKGAKPNYNGVSDSELKSWLRMAEQDLREAKRDMEKANRDYRGAEVQERDRAVGKYAEQVIEANRLIYNITEELKERERKKTGNSMVGNEKAISSTFHINDYGVEVGQWSWDWRGKAPDENKQKEIEQKIKSYVQQINKNVHAGDSDERDEVFSKLDKFVRAQGLNKKVGNYSADAFLSNAKSFAKEWSAKADGYAKAGDKQGLETLMRSAEAKYDEIKKYQDNAYQAYKDASSVADDYRALGNKISKLLE